MLKVLDVLTFHRMEINKLIGSFQIDISFPKLVVENGAAIGANATILPGIRIGAHALVGAGSVVTRDVPPGVIVYGNPAIVHGKVNQS